MKGLPRRQHLRLLCGYESRESLESKHVVGEHLYSVAVYSTVLQGHFALVVPILSEAKFILI